MPYTPPTPAQLKATFPKFAAVDDTVISGAIDRGMRNVDRTWTAGDYQEGVMLYAAHYMTLNGQGGGTEAQLLGEGVNDFQRIRLGPLDLQRFDRPATDDTEDDLPLTSYGRRFASLARQNIGGPLVT